MTNTSIVGNFVGTNAAGTQALGNSSDGIRVNGAVNTTIGGTSTGAGNVISGNKFDGIDIRVVLPALWFKVNLIGTDATGVSALGNGTSLSVGNGINIDGTGNVNTQNNQLGGTTPAARNVIAANRGAGILFAAATNGTISNNTIQGNFVGLNANRLPLANTQDGIRFDSGAGTITETRSVAPHLGPET